MEDESMTVNANGEVSSQQSEQHVFTTKVFLQIGHKGAEKEKKSLSIDSNSNFQNLNGNEVCDESVNEMRELISEAELVVVKKTPAALETEMLLEQKSTEDDTKDDTTTVESLLVNIDSVINETSPKGTHEPANDKGEALEEDAPVVIEKRPVSLHMEDVIDQGETEEQTVNGEQVTELNEPITEDDLVVVEKTPVKCALDSDILVENPEEKGKKDDYTTVESLLVNIESVIDHPAPEQTQEAADENKPEALKEDSPVIVEKRPVSLHMEHIIDQNEPKKKGDKIEPVAETELVVVKKKTQVVLESELLVDNKEEAKEEESTPVDSLLVNIESVIDDTTLQHDHKPSENKAEALEEDLPVVIEKRPFSLHMEHVLDQDNKKKDVDKREPISEAELVVVQKTPVSLESEMLAENEEANEEDSTPVESLLVNIESVIDDTTLQRDREPSEDKAGALEEDLPVVIEKRPVSLHKEHVLDQDNEKKDVDEREPISEAEVVVVQKTPVSLESEMLAENEEANEEDSTPVESLLVNIESVIDDTTLQRDREPSEDKAGALEEDLPVVIEKRPVSLHMEHVLDQDNEKKDVDEREPISEAEVVVVQKTPVSLESEMLAENEEANEEDSTPVESLLVNIESVIDDTTLQRDREPSEDKAGALEEDLPVVIEKRPVSLHMEHVLDQDDAKKDADERESISEAELVVVTKTPALVESDLLIEKEGEPKEDDTTTVASLLVNIESAIDDTAPDRTNEPQDVNKAEALEEDAPVVIEKRPVSLHLEQVIDQDETEERKDEEEPKEPITEDELVVVEKTPATLESELLVENECPEDDIATVESLFVNIESVIDHQLPEQSRVPADEEKAEELEEDEPVVIEKRPPSLRIEQVVDREENQGAADSEQAQTESKEPISEAEVVVVEKTPAALECDMLVELDTPEDDNATVESLLVNIESMIDSTSPKQTKQEAIEDSKEPIEESTPLVVKKRRVSLNMEQLAVDQKPEESIQTEVEEVVINVVEKKRVYDVQSNETQENESDVPEEPSPSIVLNIPQVDRKKDIEDTVEETVPPAIERKTTEPYHELLQTVDTKAMDIRETEILDDDEEVREPVNTEVEEPTEQTLKSNSYTKLGRKDEGGDDELLRHVLRKRLSEPEILPEMEKDGSAPLAPSESGILDSKEHVPIEDISRAREASPKSTLAKPGAASPKAEPYKDGHDEEKLIPDVPGEDKVAEEDEGAAKPLPKKEDEQGLLEVEDGDKTDEKKTKGRKDLSPPQCKCCSLM